jgi:CelD/BcsL family acetyltransferase involved in cellulose biosynthesis
VGVRTAVVPSSVGARPALTLRPPPGLTVEVVTDVAALEGLAFAWRALLTDRQVFVGPDWTIAWLAGPGARFRPHVVAVREGDRLVGVLPLASRRGTLGTCGVAEGLAHVDVVAAQGRAADVASAIVTFLTAQRWGRWRLHRVDADGALTAALRALASSRPVLERFVGACPYVEVEAGWDGFLRTLSKHQRHEATRHLRRFWAQEDVALRWVTHADEVESALDVLFDLHAKRFAALGRPTAFSVPAVRAFHGRLARRLVERDALMLGVLSLRGAPVAAAYGAHLRGTTAFFNAGIDPAFQRTGAGVVLRCHVLKDAVAGAGRRELDLLEGCQDWKLRWATGVRPILDVDVFPPSVPGRVHGALRALVRRLKARASAALHDPDERPGAQADEPADPKHCRRAGCPFAPEAAAATSTLTPAAAASPTAGRDPGA